MRRVLRHVFTACSALSLLLCVAVCVLWVRSYDKSELVWWDHPKDKISLQAITGVFGASRWQAPRTSLGDVLSRPAQDRS